MTAQLLNTAQLSNSALWNSLAWHLAYGTNYDARKWFAELRLRYTVPTAADLAGLSEDDIEEIWYWLAPSDHWEMAVFHALEREWQRRLQPSVVAWQTEGF